MGFLEALNNTGRELDLWATVVLKVIAIALISIIVLWIGISVVGNVVLSRQTAAAERGQSNLPKFPASSKARYILLVKSTGETILSNSVVTEGKVHTLHGYYEVKDRKWAFHSLDLPMDESVFGPIIIVDRLAVK